MYKTKITRRIFCLSLLLALILLVSNVSFAASIIFLHHSVGSDLIERGNMRADLTADGHQFFDHGYNYEGLRLADGTWTGISYNVPGDNTNPDGFADIFSQTLHSPPDNTFSWLMQYDVIMFKSCFTASSDLTSDAMLENYKANYRTIRAKADLYPNKLFIVVTPPPNSPGETTAANAARARAFANWLKSSEFLSGHPNIVTYDLFDALAGTDNYLLASYRSGDSHPNAYADSIVGPLFSSAIDTAIDNFHPTPPTPTCTDSDGGRVYTTAGTTTNSSSATGSDVCTSGTAVREYYCGGTGGTSVLSETVTCSSGYVCTSGACVVAPPAPTPSCSVRSASGVAGSAVTLQLDYANFSATPTAVISCGTGSNAAGVTCTGTTSGTCSGTCTYSTAGSYAAGAQLNGTVTCTANTVTVTATPPTPTCTDPDGGQVSTTASTTTNSSSASGTDSCVDTSTVREYYCGGTSGTAVLSTNLACASGYVCSAGACVVSSPPPVSGMTILDFESAVALDRSGAWTCARTTTMAHGGSYSLDLSYTSVTSEPSCGTSFDPRMDLTTSSTGMSFWLRSSRSGVPVKIMVFTNDPYDATPFEYTFNTPTASTTGWAQVTVPWSSFTIAPWASRTEALMPNRLVGIAFFLEGTGSGTLYIDDIVSTVNSTAPPTPTCNDTDGGQVSTILGTATNSSSATGTDSCLNSATVTEYYCGGTSGTAVLSTPLACASGYVCSTGRCVVAPPTPSCAVRTAAGVAGSPVTVQLDYANFSATPTAVLSCGTGSNAAGVTCTGTTTGTCSGTCTYSTAGSYTAGAQLNGTVTCTANTVTVTAPPPPNVTTNLTEKVVFTFEPVAFTRYDTTTSVFTCSMPKGTNHSGNYSMRAYYVIRPGETPACGTTFYPYELSDGTGLSFWVRASKANQSGKLLVISGDASAPTTFEVPFTVGVNWTKITTSWSGFVRSTSAWTNGTMTAIDPTRIMGVGLTATNTRTTNNSGYIWVDDVAIVRAAPGVEQTVLGFEPMAWKRYDSVNATLTCAAYSAMNHTGKYSLRMAYSNVWGGQDARCGSSAPFYPIEFASAGDRLSFWLRPSKANETVRVVLFSPDSTGLVPFEATFTTNTTMVGNWTRMTFLWSSFTRASWAGTSGTGTGASGASTVLDPYSVVGFGFAVNNPGAATTRRSATLYIDDFGVMGNETITPPAAPIPSCSVSSASGTAGSAIAIQVGYSNFSSVPTSAAIRCGNGVNATSVTCTSTGGTSGTTTGTCSGTCTYSTAGSYTAGARLNNSVECTANTVTVTTPPANTTTNFCPRYVDSELYRPRARQVVLNPSSSSTDYSWLTMIATGGSNVEYLLNSGTYQMPAVADFTYSNFYVPENVTIRSVSGNRGDVIIRGQGYSAFSLGFIIGHNYVTLADISITNNRNHGVFVVGDDHPYGLNIYNVRFYDIGTQMLKVTPGGTQNGVVACSAFEYTSTPGAIQGDYTGNSLHQVTNWVIRDNYFHNIMGDGSGCEVDIDCGTYVTHPALLVWAGSSGTVIERNVFVNNFRNIALGLGSGNDGAIVRNNFIYRSGASREGDASIEIQGATNGLVAHNTIYIADSYPGAIEISSSSGMAINNNLMNKPLWNRGSATYTASGNIDTLALDDFVTAGDVHVKTSTKYMSVCTNLASVPTDIDGQSRSARCDAGADYVNGTVSPPPPTPTCNDTDGGRVYTAVGTTTNSSSATGTDVCTSGTVVREYYCGGTSGTSVLSEDVTCASGYVCTSGACVVSSPPPPANVTGLIQPSDFQYMGAFRLPADGSCGETCSWNYGGRALTYYPAGNPTGASDGYPGSLFGTGHDVENRVSEISIPAPVNSRNINSLSTATTLQPFANVMLPLFGTTEMPKVGLEYLPKQGTQNSDKLYGGWVSHMGEGDYGASQCWFNLNISNPQIAGAWALNGQTKYAISDYILQIPSDWAAANTPNMLLATGRYRDGGQEGQGPSLIAYGPWNQGNPPAAGTVLSNIPLLKYSTYYDDPSAAHALRGYSHADAWNDAVWLRKGTKQAVAVIGVKGIGNTWYGLADGSLCPPSCDGDRGWWATRFEAQILLYDPADLAKVAKGQIPAYQPQPYAVYNITGSGALYYPAPRLGLGEAAFDSTNGILYIIEPYADGDMPEHPRPVVHVWKVKP